SAVARPSIDFDGDRIVLRAAIDQLVVRVDARARWLSADDDRERALLAVDPALLEVERLVVGVEHADVDPVGERRVVFLPERVGLALLREDLERDLVA